MVDITRELDARSHATPGADDAFERRHEDTRSDHNAATSARHT